VNRKMALELFEIDEGFSTNELEKKYVFLQKRIKNKETNEIKEGLDFQTLNDAYKVLKGIDDRDKEGQKQKLSTGELLEYYRFHIMVLVFVVGIVGYMIYTMVTKVNPDFRVAFVGAYKETKVNYIDNIKWIKDNFHDTKDPNILIMGFDRNIKSEQDVAVASKIQVTFATRDFDLYVIDKNQFDIFAKSGGLRNLDNDFAYVDSSKKCKSIIADTKEEHVYGIDLADTGFVKSIKLVGKEYIGAIRDKSDYEKKAVEFMKNICENEKR
jgi:hypothetical protein